MEGRTDGITHTRTNEGHFYSLPPPTSGDKNRSDGNRARPCYLKLFTTALTVTGPRFSATLSNFNGSNTFRTMKICSRQG